MVSEQNKHLTAWDYVFGRLRVCVCVCVRVCVCARSGCELCLVFACAHYFGPSLALK